MITAKFLFQKKYQIKNALLCDFRKKRPGNQIDSSDP